MEATDIDEGENARISYNIHHVSNNGGNKFTIDPTTGVICKHLAPPSHYLKSCSYIQIIVFARFKQTAIYTDK